MTTDFQRARRSLGSRLRELRREAGLTGQALADRLGWPQSKVSKIENGRQTPTGGDLRSWAVATGRPESGEELLARLRGLESRSRSWRRQLAAGHRPVQDALTIEYERSSVLRAWESALIVGMLQTGDYARHVFSRYADLHGSARDTEAAVQARVKRQELLYRRDQHYHIVMWEGALRARICPPAILAAQLDRLSGIIGLDTVSLGIVPFDAAVALPPANGFWIYDERLVIAEDWHREMWLDDAENVRLYRRVWEELNRTARYGAEAHLIITRARRALGTL